MKPAPFKFLRPRDQAGIIAALAEHGDEARLLAGGQSLVPMLNFRLVSPSVIIDLNTVADLDFLRVGDDEIEISALTRYAGIEDSPEIAKRCPLLWAAIGYVAHRAIRNRGTLCGSLALAYPGAEVPLVLLALDAEAKLVSSRGERYMPVRDFIRGALQTALHDDEYIHSIRIPAPARGSRTSFVEVSRRHGDYALAVACVILEASPGGGPHRIRAAASGGTAAPQLVTTIVAEAVSDSVREAVETFEVYADHQYPVEYRRHLLRTVLTRAVDEALASAEVPLGC